MLYAQLSVLTTTALRDEGSRQLSETMMSNAYSGDDGHGVLVLSLEGRTSRGPDGGSSARPQLACKGGRAEGDHSDLSVRLFAGGQIWGDGRIGEPAFLA